MSFRIGLHNTLNATDAHLTLNPVPDRIRPSICEYNNPVFENIKECLYELFIAVFKDKTTHPINSSTPLYDLLKNDVIRSVQYIEANHPDVLCKNMGKSFDGIFEELVFGLSEFKDEKQPKRILALLADIQLTLKNENLSDRFSPAIHVFGRFIDLIQDLQQVNLIKNPEGIDGSDLLAKTPSSFYWTNDPFSSSDKYRIAIRSCQFLDKAMDEYRLLISKKFSLYSSRIPGIETVAHLKIIEHYAKSSMIFKTFFPEGRGNPNSLGIDFWRLYQNLWKEFGDKDRSFLWLLETRIIRADFFEEYKKVVKQVHSIVQEKGPNDSYNQNYVVENSEVYESFIPRCEEIMKWLISSCESSIQRCTILKDIHIYIQFGDLKKLQSRLPSKNYSLPILKKVLIEEIGLFTKEVDSNSNLKRQTEEYLNKSELASVKEMRRVFNLTEDFHRENLKSILALFVVPLSHSKTCYRDLFILPFRAKTKRDVTPPLEDIKVSSSSSSEEVLEVVPEAKPTLSLSAISLMQMQNVHENTHRSIKNLKDICRNRDVDKALINAQIHFDNLLSAMKHLVQISNNPVSRKEVHAFVIDSVRHATLTAEQMLLALSHQTSQTKTSQTNMGYSHDLLALLISCELKAGPLPIELRNWVRDASHAEIVIRNLEDCALGKTPLETMLYKTYRFLNGNTQYEVKDILKDVIKFSSDACQLFYALQTQMYAAASKSSAVPSEHADQFKRLCRSIASVSDGLSVGKSVSKFQNLDLRSLQTSLDCLSKDMKQSFPLNTLNNVQKHLLVHLETEISHHASLNPIDAHPHCSNVLLLNQMIAEEILSNVANLKMIFYPKAKHDLFEMVKELGMKERDFTKDEMDFLNRGKETRQLARYAAHFNPSSKSKSSNIPVVDQVLCDALNLTLSQKFTETYDLTGGFKVRNNKNSEKLELIKKFMLFDVSILNGILIKVLKKVNK